MNILDSLIFYCPNVILNCVRINCNDQMHIFNCTSDTVVCDYLSIYILIYYGYIWMHYEQIIHLPGTFDWQSKTLMCVMNILDRKTV